MALFKRKAVREAPKMPIEELGTEQLKGLIEWGESKTFDLLKLVLDKYIDNIKESDIFAEYVKEADRSLHYERRAWVKQARFIQRLPALAKEVLGRKTQNKKLASLTKTDKIR